jgi:hypothetical protein
MPDSPLAAAGAQVAPTSTAALHTNEFFTGLWTQGNPLGAGAVPFLQAKYYSASRFDRLIGGQNSEITTRLTLARRPGSSVYNSTPFPPINRFYEFRAFQQGEQIHILASVDNIVTTTTRAVTNVQAVVVGPLGFQTGYLIVTYAAFPPPFTTGQTYTHSGCTAHPELNGVTLTVAPAKFGKPVPTSNQQIFLWGGVFASVAETGSAFITPLTAGAATVRDVTGPSNNLILWNKDPQAGRTSFQSVGNICFFADNIDAKKWVLSKDSWSPTATFVDGQFITDGNNNLQLNVGAQTATVIAILIEANVATVFLDPLTALNMPALTKLTFAGLTTVAALNGTTQTVTGVNNRWQFTFAYVHANLAFAVETGTVTTGTGITGPTLPTWATAVGGITQDGTAQWECRGPSVQNWGIAAPPLAPTVTQVPAPTVYQGWAANTWYSPNFVIIDSNGNAQRLTTAGTTGGAAPVWSLITGGVTADNTAAWTNLGSAVWAATTAYALGQAVQITFTYYTTMVVPVIYPPYYATQQFANTVTVVFVVTKAGTSGPAAPAWTNGNGTVTTDGTVIWTCIGNTVPWPGAAQALSLQTKILDSNGNVQSPTVTKKTAAVAPTWSTTVGAFTADPGQIWLNVGPYSPANSFAWQWAFSGKNSITGHIGTASPMSPPLLVSINNQPVLQGAGMANDSQIDTLVIWRTLQGGSTLVYDDEIPNPASGSDPGTWIYTDTTPDALLNELIIAPIAHANDPPQQGWTPQAYYLERIWGFKDNVLLRSGGPSTVTGSGDESFSPNSRFTFPSLGVTCWPTSIGLICYTNSDIWVVLGQGTTDSPFYVVNFQTGVGLGGQDAFTVNGSTAYGMLTSGQVVSMDPGAGEIEVGFAIGDQFDSLYDPAETYMAWHQGSSKDMALYVGDGALGWFRMAALAAPEDGNVWSPRALIQGGVKAIASVEISPGVKRLLLGPAAPNNPILMRDQTTNADNTLEYPASANIGSLVLAQPGGTVGVQFITTEETMIEASSPVSVGVLLDEISGAFSNLTKSSNDPPNLPQSKTVRTKRFWVMQNAQPISCRHMQVEMSWEAENYPNELLTYTIYGRMPEKARK